MQPFLIDMIYFSDVFEIKQEETKYVWEPQYKPAFEWNPEMSADIQPKPIIFYCYG